LGERARKVCERELILETYRTVWGTLGVSGENFKERGGGGWGGERGGKNEDAQQKSDD